jgi:hypothetical protein
MLNIYILMNLDHDAEIETNTNEDDTQIPPPYDNKDQEMLPVIDFDFKQPLSDQKSHELKTYVNVSHLNDIVNGKQEIESNCELYLNFEQEIMNIIMDQLKQNLILRMTIQLYTEKNPLKDDVIIKTYEAKLKFEKDCQPGRIISVIVQNDKIKNSLKKRLDILFDKEDMKEILYKMYTSTADNFDFSRLIKTGTRTMMKNDKFYYDVWIRYDKLKGEFLTKCDEIAKRCVTKRYIDKLSKGMERKASIGELSYTWIDKNAEFGYEYFKYYNIFNDLKMTLGDEKVTVSWATK